MVDLLLADVAKLEHEERLKHMQLLYELRAVPAGNPGLGENLLLGLSRWLIGAGEQLRQRVEMRPGLR